MLRVQVFGTFDYFHPGHQFVLSEAQKRGQLFVTVALDATVERIKGFAPKFSVAERIQAIRVVFPEAVVFAGAEENYVDSISKVQPDLILLGYDQQLPPGIQEADIQIPIERLEAFEPEKWKSSLLRKEE